MRFIKEHVLLYQHLIENTLRHNPFEPANDNPQKIEIFEDQISVRQKQLFLMIEIIYYFVVVYYDVI